MPKIALLFSTLLIVLGVIGYLGSGAGTKKRQGNDGAENSIQKEQKEELSKKEKLPKKAAPEAKKRSVTALIPAFFGGDYLGFVA